MPKALEFLSSEPLFYQKADGCAPLWEEVHNQAIEHTRRLTESSLLKTQRPSEPGKIQKYRNDNKRSLTKDGVDRFSAKVTRVLQNSGLSVHTISAPLSEYLETAPFEVSSKGATLWAWVYQCVFPIALDDPNAVAIAFPINSVDAELPPALQPANLQVGIENLIIPSGQVLRLTSDIFAMRMGTAKIKKAEYDVFYVCDETEWIQYYPVERTEGGASRIVYEPILWYIHDGGNLPVTRLPGYLASSENDSNKKYHESIIRAYYEYADEFINRFSDNQAVTVQHSYPKPIFRKLPCTRCKKGKIHSTYKGEAVEKTCEYCMGSGYIHNIDPYDSLIIPTDAGSLSDYAAYLSPPTEALAHGHSAIFDILNRGFRAIGLNLVNEGTPESGEAKRIRLQDLTDILFRVGNLIFDFVESHLWNLEVLLVVGERQVPVVTRPKNYDLKDEEDILEQIKMTFGIDRLQLAEEYYQKKFNGDPLMTHVMHLVLNYSPLAILDDAEINQRLARDIYDEDDVVRRDRSLWVFKLLAETDERFMERTDQDNFARADAILVEAGYLDLSEEEQAEPEPDIPETVGGAEEPDEEQPEPVEEIEA